jgi:hypothetical protein
VTIASELIFVSPKEITSMVQKHLDRLSASERLQCMSIAVRYFLVNPDPEIAAGWCSVFVSISEQKLMEIKGKALGLFTAMLQWVWSHSAFVSDQCVTSFLHFKNTFRISDSILSNQDLSEERKDRISSDPTELASVPEKVHRFAFVRFSPALLSTELRPESPYLLTQLRFGTYEFSNDQLRNLLVESLSQGRVAAVSELLKYIVRHNRPFEILRDFDLKEVGFDLLLPVFERDFDRSVFVNSGNLLQAVEILSFSQQIQSLISLDRVKTRDLRNVMKIFHLIPNFDGSRLIPFCSHCLRIARTEMVIPLLGIVINQMTAIPGLFLAEIVAILQESYQVLPIDPVSILLLRIISRFKTSSDVHGLVRLLLSNYDMVSHPQSRLLEALLAIDGDIPDIFRTICSYLNSSIPSYFRCGLQLMATVMTEQAVRSCRDLLRNCFSIFFERLYVFQKEQPVIDLVPPLLKAVIDNTEFDRLRTSVVKSISQFSWNSNSPHFIRFEDVFVSLLQTSDPSSSISKQFCQLTSGLFKIPSLFNMYLSCLKGQLKAIPDTFKRMSMLIDALLKWCMNSQSESSYGLADEVYQWALLLASYVGVDDAIAHLCFTICEHMPRFYPYFKGLMMFLQVNRDCQSVDTSLENASLRMHQASHARAFRIAAETKNYQAALRAALLEPDSDDRPQNQTVC